MFTHSHLINITNNRMLKRNHTLAKNLEIDGYLFRGQLINQNSLLEQRTEIESKQPERTAREEGVDTSSTSAYIV